MGFNSAFKGLNNALIRNCLKKAALETESERISKLILDGELIGELRSDWLR